MVLSKAVSESDMSVHSTFASRYVRPVVPPKGASNPVEAEAGDSNGNNHAQYDASKSVPDIVAMTENFKNNYSNMVSRTTAAEVTDNLSTLVVNTSEIEKRNKATLAFFLTSVDKMATLCDLIISGVVYSHGLTPLLRISDAWIQVLFAGGVISTISCIILSGSASYFKEIESPPDHPGFVVCSWIVLFKLLFLVLLTCIVLLGIERSSKWVILPFGVVLLLSIVLVWYCFQHQQMIVGLKWAKNAFEWMKAKISEWRLRDETVPQMQA